ncbi:hypothetical protein [Geotoga petraea]|uniref:Uncharacterized protein n=1 Tax=Geotoga petraea TaxID=28234 RepID=A0A1G6NV73_9BACT|nr:hypothetical protein [Geotoga petraea]TGG85902.1 hypothetical protein E4650_10145 [Geotoga petraea]SDC71055.1 hypothetical protein SAMN04488588_1653 [Geotoga petraea]
MNNAISDNTYNSNGDYTSVKGFENSMKVEQKENDKKYQEYRHQAENNVFAKTSTVAGAASLGNTVGKLISLGIGISNPLITIGGTAVGIWAGLQMIKD